MKKLILQITFILLLGAVLALTYNSINPRGLALWAGSTSAQSQPPGGGFSQITLQEVYKIYQKPEVALLDARSTVEYNYGHIKGALSLPDEEFDKKYPGMIAKLSNKKEIIVYCSGEGCGLSEHLAKKLKTKGHRNIKLFVGGWPAWLQAEYPTDK